MLEADAMLAPLTALVSRAVMALQSNEPLQTHCSALTFDAGLQNGETWGWGPLKKMTQCYSILSSPSPKLPMLVRKGGCARETNSVRYMSALPVARQKNSLTFDAAAPSLRSLAQAYCTVVPSRSISTLMRLAVNLSILISYRASSTLRTHLLPQITLSTYYTRRSFHTPCPSSSSSL